MIYGVPSSIYIFEILSTGRKESISIRCIEVNV
jgi:hypothetical protein